MDPEKVDSVTADSLQGKTDDSPGDIILTEDGFVSLATVDDLGDSIVVSDEDGNVITFSPDQKVDIYLYPGVDIE